MFAVVSVYIPEGKDKRIVHCWGLHETRKDAINHKNRLRTRQRRDAIAQWITDFDQVTNHVCEVMDDAFFAKLNEEDANEL